MVLVNLATHRDMLTASVRMEYYHTAARIFCRFPAVGAGLGEFQTWHMRLKPLTFDESRDAHSVLFSWMSQCGTPGLLAACVLFLLPLLLVFGFLKRHRSVDLPLAVAIITGWSGWLAHSLLQFNDMIPSTCTIASFLGLYFLAPASDKPAAQMETPPPRRVWFIRLPFLILALVCLGTLRQVPGEITLQHGEQILYSKSPTSALPVLKQACRQLPFSPTPPRLLDDYANSLGDATLALESAQALARRTPHRGSSYCRLAKAHLLNQDCGAALKMLETARLWYPSSPQAAYLAALTRLLPELGLTQTQLPEWLAVKAEFNREFPPDAVELQLSQLPTSASPLFLQRLNDVCQETYEGKPIRFTPKPPPVKE
jgi:hypothetical protein